MKALFLAIAFFSVFFWQSAFAQLWCNDAQHPFSGYMFVNNGASLSDGLGSLLVLRPSVFIFANQLNFTTGPLGVEEPHAQVCLSNKCASESSGDSIAGPRQNLVYLEADVTFIKKGRRPEGPELMVIKATDRRYALSADWMDWERRWRILLHTPEKVKVLGVSGTLPLFLNTPRKMRFEVDNKGARLFVHATKIIDISISKIAFELGQSTDDAAFDTINAAFAGPAVGDTVYFDNLRVFAKCSCENECAFAGERGCADSSSVRVCGNFDPDACLEWKPAESCTAPEVCSAGKCVQPSVSMGVNALPNPLVEGEQAEFEVTVNNLESNPADASISLDIVNAISGNAVASASKTISVAAASSAKAVFSKPEIDTTAFSVGTYKAVAKTTIFGKQITETAFFTVIKELKSASIPELHPLLAVVVVLAALYIINKK